MSLTKVIINARYAIRSKDIGKRDPIKLYAKLTAKLLMRAYKSKVIKNELNEDLLQHRIYFLTFME